MYCIYKGDKKDNANFLEFVKNKTEAEFKFYCLEKYGTIKFDSNVGYDVNNKPVINYIS